MKKSMLYSPAAALALVTASLLYTPSAIAAGEAVGETQRCVSLGQIKDSPVIDDQTILVKMKGSGGFKRIDLMGTCSGLSFNGYARSSPENSICTSDTLTVIGPVRNTCKIEKIVTINEGDATALEAKRN